MDHPPRPRSDYSHRRMPARFAARTSRGEDRPMPGWHTGTRSGTEDLAWHLMRYRKPRWPSVGRSASPTGTVFQTFDHPLIPVGTRPRTHCGEAARDIDIKFAPDVWCTAPTP